MALDYGFGVELCTPARAQEKGSVENLVGFAKGSFFKVRRFQDHADMVSQLAEWHIEVNEVRPCRATGVTPAARIAAERERLRPLAIAPEDYALRFPVMVGPTGVVPFEGYRYSMPPEAIGILGTLWLYRERVRIVAGRHVSEHARVPECGCDSFHPEHRTARLAKVAGERGRLYLKRQELLDLGPVAEMSPIREGAIISGNQVPDFPEPTCGIHLHDIDCHLHIHGLLDKHVRFSALSLQDLDRLGDRSSP